MTLYSYVGIMINNLIDFGITSDPSDNYFRLIFCNRSDYFTGTSEYIWPRQPKPLRGFNRKTTAKQE